jgi:hypothetical protein
VVETDPNSVPKSSVTAREGLGFGIAEVLGLGQIIATGTKLGVLIFVLINVLIAVVILVQAWRRRAYGFAILATVILVAASAVGGAYVDHVVFKKDSAPSIQAGPSATPGRTLSSPSPLTGTAPSSPASTALTSPTPNANNGAVVLSTTPLPPRQGSTWNVAATSVQIGTATFPDSIRFTCSGPGFGSGSITYTVAGYKFLDSTVGVPNDATNGVGNTATVTFLKDGTTQLATPLTIVVGRPQTVHLDLQGATQLQIQCAAKSSNGNGAPMDVALGEATLLPAP